MTPTPARLTLAVITTLVAASPGAALADGPALADDAVHEGWSAYLPTDVIGARAFVRASPQHDGRGVVVAVLDTGVDPRAAGLTKTSAGAPKVIEARDFSGQGDVPLREGRVEDTPKGRVLRVGSDTIRGLDACKGSVDGRYWFGRFRERQIGPRALRDINHDGKRDSALALVLWRTGPGPDDVRAALDFDGDDDLTDAPQAGPYSARQELLVPPPRKAAADVALLTMALHYDHRREVAELHFTDGSHGTHVAGIIAGHDVFGKRGWDGVAPGAQILSLKIGHNARAGGATTTRSFKRALQYAATWSSQRGVPVVVNASYGIGSAIEGQSDIDAWVDELVAAHPLLTLSFSAGNEGPGISSVGTPAAARLALAVGAQLPADTVPTLYGGKLAGDRIFSFSSRGGELTKPEVIAPGIAATSVPVWDGRPTKQGTSMAAPQVAGAMALLWSALAGKPGSDHGGVHSGVIRRALMWSARPMKGYGLLDQGHGLIDVGAAAKLARRLASKAEPSAVLGYAVDTHAPHLHGAPMPGALWRSGLPASGPVEVPVEVRALLPKTTPAEKRRAFSTVLTLRSDAPWLQPAKPEIVVRAGHPTPFRLRVDGRKLRRPGAYTARVIAKPRGAAADEAAFETWQTVVVPHRPDAASGYAKRWTDIKLGPGDVFSQFVAVPPGATSAQVEVRRRGEAFAATYLALFDPEGHRIRPAHRVTSSRDQQDAIADLDAERLAAGGTWELTVSASPRAARTSAVDLEVRFAVAHIEPVRKLAKQGAGGHSGTARVINRELDAFVGTATAQLTGRRVRGEHKGKPERGKPDRLTIPVALGAGERAAALTLTIDPKLYNTTTDIGVTVRAPGGKIVAISAFSEPRCDVSWRHGGGAATYTVEVEPGFTHRRDKPWKVKSDLTVRYGQPVALGVKRKGKGRGPLMAYPGVPLGLTVEGPALPALPAGSAWHGAITLTRNGDKRTWVSIPIEAKP